MKQYTTMAAKQRKTNRQYGRPRSQGRRVGIHAEKMTPSPSLTYTWICSWLSLVQKYYLGPAGIRRCYVCVRVAFLLAPHGTARMKSGKISTHLTTVYWKLSSTVWSGLNAPLSRMKLSHVTKITQSSHSINNNVVESEFWVTLPGVRIWNREFR